MPSPLAPPAVRYPLAQPPALAVGLGLLWLLAATVLLGWALQPQAGGLRQAAALWTGLAAAWGLRRGWRSLGRGQLAWDGAQWWLQGQGAGDAALAVSLRVWADGGGWLWVQARVADGSAGSRWLLLAASHIPPAWGELRRAVYLPARLPDPPQ